MDATVLGVLGTLVTALVGGAVAFYGYKSSRVATREQTAIDKRRLESEITDTLLSRLRSEVNELRSDREEDRVELAALREKVEHQADDIARTNRRLDDAMRRYKSAMKYIRTLLAFIAEHVPGKPPPPPPEDLVTDVDG